MEASVLVAFVLETFAFANVVAELVATASAVFVAVAFAAVVVALVSFVGSYGEEIEVGEDLWKGWEPVVVDG